MSENDTKYHVSSGRPLTPAEIARLDEIEARLGDSVDAPEMSDEAWTSARRMHRRALERQVVPAASRQ